VVFHIEMASLNPGKHTRECTWSSSASHGNAGKCLH